MPSVPSKKQKLSSSSLPSNSKKQKTSGNSSKAAATSVLPPPSTNSSNEEDDDDDDDSDSASSSSSYHSDRDSDDDRYGARRPLPSRSLSPQAEPIKVTSLPSRIKLPTRLAKPLPSSSTSSNPAASTSAVSLSSKPVLAAAESDSTPSDEPSTSSVPAPAPAPSSTFQSLGCSPALISSMGAMSIRKPTPIQQGCIPAILAGRDCIGIAQTGSGKTLAFALPILQRIARDPYGVWAVVLTPTRELAFQLAEQFHILGVPLNITTSVVVGGMDIITQAQAMCARPHVVVATPGRLVDLLRSSGGEWGLDRVQTLVLDEADRMLTPTFAPDLAYLFSRMPVDRQTCLFTATESDAIRTLEEKEPRAGKDKIFVHKVLMDTTTVSTLKQHYLFIPSHIREPYLYYLLLNPPKSILHLRRPNPNLPKPSASTSSASSRKRDRSGPGSKASKPTTAPEDEAPPWPPSTIIFTSRCATTAHIHSLLTELLIPSVALHSYLSQKERLASLAAFRSGQVPVLVATDVGSRGLDIPEVAMVVNWDCPREAEDYVHRVGRTARAGRGGVAVTMVTERDTELVGGIEKVIKATLTELVLPEAAVLEDLNKVSTAKRVAAMSLHDAGFGEKQKTRAVLEGKRRKRDAARNA